MKDWSDALLYLCLFVGFCGCLLVVLDAGLDALP